VVVVRLLIQYVSKSAKGFHKPIYHTLKNTGFCYVHRLDEYYLNTSNSRPVYVLTNSSDNCWAIFLRPGNERWHQSPGHTPTNHNSTSGWTTADHLFSSRSGTRLILIQQSSGFERNIYRQAARGPPGGKITRQLIPVQYALWSTGHAWIHAGVWNTPLRQHILSWVVISHNPSHQRIHIPRTSKKSHVPTTPLNTYTQISAEHKISCAIEYWTALPSTATLQTSRMAEFRVTPHKCREWVNSGLRRNVNETFDLTAD